ncbi:hypothetical protein OSTOST_10090 [Ostertagia ostertagi]
MRDYQASFQVAVIFAILLGGLLLLALVIGGIYFVCVNNMRDSDQKTASFGRGGIHQRHGRHPRRHPTLRHIVRDLPPRPCSLHLLLCRVMTAESPAQGSTQYMTRPQYSTQVPLVTPTRVEEFGPSVHYRPLQPDVIYTQGPSGYIQSTPVEYTVTSLPSYHQSSV